ncbi:peptide chain release factor 3 [soil metagenome]
MTTSVVSRPTELEQEVARRRTFAIISHPDAGKTTLTEKLLLYGGAIELAGSVRARKNQRQTTSDWMELEQQRGISVTATALQFDWKGVRLNLLDTPGHEDFSEDTYRTLMAVDSAVMVIDAARGIESQTRKLFDVCRQRQIPILVFVNKLDHPSREPLALLEEIEQVLEIDAVPLNWPIGDGPTFQGIYDLRQQQVLQFSRTAHGQTRAPVEVATLDGPELTGLIGEQAAGQLREDVELLTVAGETFEFDRYIGGDLAPVFFGSALTNFGVEVFLDALIDLAPPPQARPSDRGMIDPTNQEFSGFVFKIQANMDPRHRDCMAFLRVCSGHFEKGVLVHHPRLGRDIRLARPHRLFAGDRETVESAYPGDVVGLVNPGVFAIGDTVCTGEAIQYRAIPRFQPERFARLVSNDISRTKQMAKGLAQLDEEGAIQVFHSLDGTQRAVILGAVGDLQFEVTVARLESEYGVTVRIEHLPYQFARWVDGTQEQLASAKWPRFGVQRVVDRNDHVILLFDSDRAPNFFTQENPSIPLRDLP